MAYSQQQPSHGGSHYFPSSVVAELEAPEQPRPTWTTSADGGPIFEMSGEPAVARQDKPPLQAVGASKPIQANPWPFCLEDTPAGGKMPGEADRTGDDGRDDSVRGAQKPANPWPYFGPQSTSEDLFDEPAREPTCSAEIHDTPGGEVVSVSIKQTGLDSNEEEEEPRPAEGPKSDEGGALNLTSHLNRDSENDPSAASNPAPLAAVNQQSSQATYKPYYPPNEQDATLATSLHRRVSVPSGGSQDDSAIKLPFRPYRPASTSPTPAKSSIVPPPVRPSSTAASSGQTSAIPPRKGLLPRRPVGADQVASVQTLATEPLKSPSPSVIPAIGSTPSATGSKINIAASTSRPPGSPPHSSLSNPPGPKQQHLSSPSPGSSSIHDGAAPHHFYNSSEIQALNSVAAAGRPVLESIPAPQKPPTIQGKQDGGFSAEVFASSSSSHLDQYPMCPVAMPQARFGSPHSSTAGLSTTTSTPGCPTPGPPPVGPSPGPSPGVGMVPLQPQYGSPMPHPNPYPAASPIPSTFSQANHAASPYSTPLHISPPPTTSYDIPQPTYAPAFHTPPPQPPMPQFQHASTDPNLSPQLSPQSPPPPYNTNINPQQPMTHSQNSAHPSAFYMPPGPAMASYQYQYPHQPTYVTSAEPLPYRSSQQDQYAPPLPPRPENVFGNQPQPFSGFGSGPQNAMYYPPPPKKQYSQAPSQPPPPRPSSSSAGGRLFSSSSALKWLDKTSTVLENKLEAVLQGPQGPPNRPLYAPVQPPRPPQTGQYYPPQSIPGSYPRSQPGTPGPARGPPRPAW